MNTKKLTYTGLLLALGVILPQLFHIIGGQTAGSIFLPMHIPVLIAGLLLGWKSGLTVGILSPILSFLVASMPMPPVLYFMVVELAAYGFVSGYLKEKLKLNIYINLAISMVVGRMFQGIAILVLVYILGVKIPSFLTTIPLLVKGLPGIAIQFAFVPPLVYLIKRGMKDA